MMYVVRRDFARRLAASSKRALPSKNLSENLATDGSVHPTARLSDRFYVDTSGAGHIVGLLSNRALGVASAGKSPMAN